MKLDKDEALYLLSRENAPFLQLFRHGSLSVEIYKPEGKDLQQPHNRDEVYIIISGSGKFQSGGKLYTFRAGDFFFVPAGTIHSFKEFSPDFATWVIFYGPEGGEVQNG